MINKFEAVGIGISIMAMAAALFLFRVETATSPLTSAEPAEQQASLVAAGDSGQSAVRSALLDASTDGGSLQKVVIDDVIIGEGRAVAEGDTITVNYIGTLQNGQQFDNSYTRGTPFTFTVGGGKVITGWEQGVVGMKLGGQRILVIPAQFGYGDKGYGPIPGGATLVFAIELLEIK